MDAVIVRGSYKGYSGHDYHVREFVRHMVRRGLHVQLVDVPEWGTTRLPEHMSDPFFGTLLAPVGAGVILHFCFPTQVHRVAKLRNVNYTMFEGTHLPPGWAQASTKNDLVVVPTKFSAQTWVSAGHPAERVRVCPLGVDPRRFRPDLEPLDLTDRRGRRAGDYRHRFLNVSEVVPRKNLVGLLRAWIRATTPDDDAVLVLKVGCYIPLSSVKLMREVDQMERSLGKTRKDAAPVIFIDRVFSDDEICRLFASATHYLSLSHGEGWDNAMTQAAATDLRLIAPRHSAYTTYLCDSIATLLPVRLVPATFEGDEFMQRLFSTAEWWEPDEDAAVEAIRAALMGKDAPKQSPRRRMRERFTWARAAKRLVTLLDELRS